MAVLKVLKTEIISGLKECLAYQKRIFKGDFFPVNKYLLRGHTMEQFL